VRARARAR